MNNNPAPWARTAPADPANVLREIGAQIPAEKRKELQALLQEDKKLQLEFDRLCSERALKENRDAEFKLHSDLSVSAEAAAEKIRELRQFSEKAPVIRDHIEHQRAEITKKFCPMAAELCDSLIKAIRAQLNSLPKIDVASRWGIPLDGDFYDALTFPLYRLLSMVEYDLPLFRSGRAATDQTNFTAHYLIETAGLFTKPAKV